MLILLAWLVFTLSCAVGLVAFLAFDEWQVRSQQSKARRPEQIAAAQAVQAT